MLLCVLALYAACEPIQENVDELVVYNWADYIYDYEDDFKAYYKSLTGRGHQGDLRYLRYQRNHAHQNS